MAETRHEPVQLKKREWLINIITKDQKGSSTDTTEKQDQPTGLKPRIQKVDNTLVESNKACFVPLVVSFGPLHHGEQNLLPMENYKEDAVLWFISHAAMDKPANSPAEKKERAAVDEPANSRAKEKERANDVYDKFIEKFREKVTSVSSPRDCYADDESVRKYNEEDLMQMMFLDGCFILHFIHLVVNGWSDLSKNSLQANQAKVVRDMFLLENQIPFSVLDALMSLLPESPGVMITEFIHMVFLPPYEVNFSEIGCWRVPFLILELLFDIFVARELYFIYIWSSLFQNRGPLHLLDILREMLIRKGARSGSSCGSGSWHYYFRPIRELKATGIQVRRNNAKSLKDVKFIKGHLNSYLEIPQIMVDDSTETRLLNLIAFEMCPDGPLDRMVTSYVCFLHSLIYNADDVKELQSENILLNRLGSNEGVATLFRKMATNLSPDCNVYGSVIDGIKDHHRRHFNRERVQIGEWIGQFIRTYFTSPWTVISLTAAIVLLLLTLLQTIYTMWGFYKT